MVSRRGIATFLCLLTLFYKGACRSNPPLCSIKRDGREMTVEVGSDPLQTNRSVAHLDFVGEVAGSNPTIALYLVSRERGCGDVTCASFFHLVGEELFVRPQRSDKLMALLGAQNVRVVVMCRPINGSDWLHRRMTFTITKKVDRSQRAEQQTASRLWCLRPVCLQLWSRSLERRRREAEVEDRGVDGEAKRNTTLPAAPTMECPPDFTAPFVVFLVLFLLSLPIIGFLVYRMRKYKADAEAATKRFYSVPTRQALKYENFNPVKPPLVQDEPHSPASSQKSTPQPDLKSARSLDVPHIAPIGAHIVKRKNTIPEDEMTSVAPYHGNPVQDWNTEEEFATLSLKQIRVENWHQDTEVKKCGVGEVNLGSPLPCFVKILKGDFGDKISATDDVVAMSHVLHYKSCDHPNLVKFYGSCVSRDSLYMVSEFISSRTLLSVLVSSRTVEHSAVISTMSGAQLINYAIGIGDAIFYLHSNDLVHGALSVRHVILTEHMVPKLYECCGENSKRIRLKSCRWSAPELHLPGVYTEKADIWSFGVLMWEILSLGGRPFHEWREEKVPLFIRRQLQSGGSVLPLTRNTTKRLWLLLQSCWAEDPSGRPLISDIVSRLKRMRDASNSITVARPPGYTFFPAGLP